jgi:hypothetical protein
MVDYTDEELMIFLNHYMKIIGVTTMTLKDFKKDIVDDKNGVFCSVSDIPFNELPLYINGDTHYTNISWYIGCVSIRLKLGK